MAGNTRITAKMNAILTVLPGAIGGMDAETQDAFAEEIGALIAKYGKKAEQTAETAPQTRKGRKVRQQQTESEPEHVDTDAAQVA